jgi:type IV secretion system protein VirD4
MVSRQETSRPLLTPGEVMQLSPADELVLIAGLPPIRAAKLRYFEDGNFAARRLPPPVLSAKGYVDVPPCRAHDWTAVPTAAPASPVDTDDQTAPDVAQGVQQTRERALGPVRKPREPDPRQPELSLHDRIEVEAHALMPSQVRAAYGMSQGADRGDDLLSGVAS